MIQVNRPTSKIRTTKRVKRINRLSRQIKEDEAAADATSDQNSTVETSGSDSNLVLEDEVKLEQVNASSTVEVKKAHSGGHKPGSWLIYNFGYCFKMAYLLKYN